MYVPIPTVMGDTFRSISSTVTSRCETRRTTRSTPLDGGGCAVGAFTDWHGRAGRGTIQHQAGGQDKWVLCIVPTTSSRGTTSR